MKFTKEEAVKELTAKYKPRYGEPDKWERTIQESVEHAMKLIGEESEIELDAFVGSVMPFLDTTAGFVLKETSSVASGFNQQLEDLRKKVNEPKIDKTEPDSELLRRLEALEKASEESKRLEAVAQKRNEIASKLKDKGVKNSKWVDLMLQKAQITADTDAEKESSDYLELYNKMFAEGGEYTPPLTPKGEANDKAKAVIEEAAQIAKERIA